MDDNQATYAAHVSDDGSRTESVRTHLNEVAEMAASFADAFGAREWGYAAGLLHDIGKYSNEFQRRILSNGPRVDHSTAGAYIADNRCSKLLAYCIAGHHAGLPDGGVEGDFETTLIGRLTKAKRGLIPSYEAYKDEVTIPSPLGFPFSIDESRQSDKAYVKDVMYEWGFFTRMLFSCLVDADYLCTERFMRGTEREQAAKLTLPEMRDLLEDFIAGFYPPQSEINTVRCGVLDDCKCASTCDPGVFSLTVPTGGGKTYALMRFALQHATAPGHSFDRVICAEPYTSIIEQNAEVYRKVFGSESVLEHHSNYDFTDNESSSDSVMNRLRLTAENWDIPLVVTTNVQLFESLHANKTSHCRKLHNVARSVIVLDEAQMIPTQYLQPCIKALAELVKHYGCSIVLCTATQPSLNDYFDKEGLCVREIASNPERLVDSLRRVSYKSLGQLDDEELAQKLAVQKQALCIVNSRKQARALYDRVSSLTQGDDASVFHLTTLMYPQHRSKSIDAIRARLKAEKPCVVIATSLIEAGVDLDFGTVFRAVAGVDSIVQAAGRCNREMKKTARESFVYLFDPATQYAIPPDVRQRLEVSTSVIPALRENNKAVDADSLDVIAKYFKSLYFYRSLDDKEIVEQLSPLKALSYPFAKVASEFCFVDDVTCTVIVPTDSNRRDIESLNAGYASRGTMRRLAHYGVGIYQKDRDALLRAGAIEVVGENLFLLIDQSLYKEEVGLDLSVVAGEAVFL